jgi:hypothetical protein
LQGAFGVVAAVVGYLGLLTCGFCTIFLPGGMAIARFAAGLPG